ncbi:MAG: hypothetical protein OSJ60_17245 [Lachnospiraceae bacterium]|nr:hypothetical protein [Lachnospiraceae bacterium]
MIICFNVEGALWINEKMEMNRMEIAVKEIYAETLEQQQIEVRQGVMDGIRQARKGKAKVFNAVCDRLEEKYTNAKI